MRRIGLLGGMSWESTTEYYRIINREVAGRLGGLHSAELVLHSGDFARVESWLREGRWERLVAHLSAAARTLVEAGAECLLICTNTMHQVAGQVEAAARVPLLHIADATGREARRRGLRRVALLGSRVTMEADFYRARLESRHGVEVCVPEAEDRAWLDQLIFGELCRGQVRDGSRRRLVDLIERLAAEGAEAAVLGCTELPLLVGAPDTPVALLDTTRLHALSAVEFALADREAQAAPVTRPGCGQRGAQCCGRHTPAPLPA